MNSAALGLVVTFGIMTAAVLLKVGVTPRQSLSQHIARSSQTIWYGRIGLAIGGVLFVLLCIGYVAPKYELGEVFMIVSILSAFLGAAAGLFPYDVSKRRDLFHDVCSYGYVVLNPVLLSLILVELPDSSLRNAFIAGLVGQLVIIVLLATYRPLRKYFLFGQLLFLGIFASLLVLL